MTTNSTSRAAHSAAVDNDTQTLIDLSDSRSACWTDDSEYIQVAEAYAVRMLAKSPRLSPSEWAEAVERVAAALCERDNPNRKGHWSEVAKMQQTEGVMNFRRRYLLSADELCRAAFPEMAPTEDTE